MNRVQPEDIAPRASGDWAQRWYGVRPLLDAVSAGRATRDRVLRRTGTAGAERDDPWYPETVSRDAPCDLLVAPGQPGGFATVQAAVEAAILRAHVTGEGGRIRIGITPGRYAGLVYLPKVAAGGEMIRFTLIGLGEDPREVELVESIDAEMPGPEYRSRFLDQFRDASPETQSIFVRIRDRGTLSTANASVVRAEADGTQLCNLTIRNSYGASRATATSDDTPRNARGQFSRGQHQAVAFLSAGADRVVLDRVYLKSFQDTLYLRSPDKRTTCRSWIRNCDIEGDVDFIFGQSTAWFEGCVIRALGSREAPCWLTAPSTHMLTPYGFVFDRCRLVHDGSPKMSEGRVALGRQWFEGVRASPYGQAPVSGYRVTRGAVSTYDPPLGEISDSSLYSVGKCLFLNCAFGRHLNHAAPWDDWSGPGYGRDGVLLPGKWSARYRPFQLGPADMRRFLENWEDAGDLGLDRVDPGEAWLGEFNSVTLSDEESVA